MSQTKRAKAPMPPAAEPAAQHPAAAAPREIQRREFARRLNARMLAKGWRQSDLARAAFGTTKNSTGHTVPRRRDSISSYLAGKTWPDQQSLGQLAGALGCTVDDLLPNEVMRAIDAELPALEIKQAEGHPDKTWIRVNQLVTLDQALDIAAILRGPRGVQ